MSDLHCAATVLVTRPGEAGCESDVPGDAGGSLTSAGRREAERLADALAQRNVAILYTSPLARAVQTAGIVAGRLGCVVRVRDELTELSAAVPGAEEGATTVARVRGVLEEVADLHRGETVLVVSHGAVMSLVLPWLAANLPDDHAADRSLPSCAPVELSADADGWWCAAWPQQ